MAANEIHKGDIGTQFLITVYDNTTVKNLSSFVVIKFIFRKPSGTITTVDGSFYTDGSDGIVKYITVDSTLLNEVGVWHLQLRLADAVSSPTHDRYTDIGHFYVFENLE